jgi:hypothetical protein
LSPVGRASLTITPAIVRVISQLFRSVSLLGTVNLLAVASQVLSVPAEAVTEVTATEVSTPVSSSKAAFANASAKTAAEAPTETTAEMSTKAAASERIPEGKRHH